MSANDRLSWKKSADDRDTGPARDGGVRGGTRRKFLAAGGAAVAASVGGCLGLTESGDSSDEGPEPPWTTEDLADHVDDGTKVTIYAASGNTSTWKSLVKIINDEFDVKLDPVVFNAGGSKVSQRVIQERQAGEDQADVVSYATDIMNMIRTEGRSVAEKYFEWDVQKNFWFKDVLPKERMLPWWVSAYDGVASSVMPLNEELFEEKGLDHPTSYNDLFDDQYEGLEMIIPADPVISPFGWIISYHAEQTDMSNEEWITTLLDRFELTPVSSHTTGAREVSVGNAPLMFYNFPSTISEFVSKHPLKGNFVDPVEAKTWSGPLSINKKAPNPWAARLFVSAALEAPVQKRMIHEAAEMTPARSDLDYSTVDPDPYTLKRLKTNTVKLTWDEYPDVAAVGDEAREKWTDY